MWRWVSEAMGEKEGRFDTAGCEKSPSELNWIGFELD